MAHYTSTIRGPSHVVSNSYVQSMKPTKMVDIRDNRSTDHSIFIGYGSNAKRIKDRWEATKKQLRFENNYIALKWLLDSFVDDYLRSKNMEDTATLTRETVSVKRERRVDEVSTSQSRRSDEVSASQSRRSASQSPSKTRFEEVVSEQKENGIIDKPSHSNASEIRQHVSSMKDLKPRPSSEGSRIASDMHIAGQYPYKYVPEYWSPYYHWHGNVPLNARMVNVSSIPGYSGYMMKTPSCSSLPTRDTHKPVGGLRTSESLKQLNSSGNGKDERGESCVSEKRPAVNLGFKTKSMPNLQFIPKESDGNSEEEEEIESDPESQGDLIALSASSLSMPNLRKIPPDRAPRLSPPQRGHYEPTPLLRDRHDVCNASSFSMPNLNAIQGIRPDEHDSRKKTIREFVINRLTKTDHEQAELKTKIFNPNGYYPPSTMRDSERKLVIRERLLNRMAKRKREETSRVEVPGSHYNGKMTSQVTSHLKFAKKLPRVPESRLWVEKNYAQAPSDATRTVGKEDRANNNWKVPLAVGSSEQQSSPRGMWNRSPVKKSNANIGIWNPADVHVKRESSSPATQDDVAAQGSMASSATHPAEDEHFSRPSSANAVSSVGEGQAEENRDEDEGISEDEEEHVDVENVKEDEAEESGESESDDQDEEASEDDKKNKRTRKTDKPRKRLKAM